MVNLSIFSALVLLGVWICYIFKLFPLNDYTLIHIFMPLDILLMLSPLVLRRTKFVYHPFYKYFLIFCFLFVVAILNIVIPKHAVLGYALIVLLTNHYYSPRLGRRVFFVTLIIMLLCMYAGMFFGEYDSNLLTQGIIKTDTAGQIYVYEPATPLERWEFLHAMVEQGRNRYLEVFLYYYCSRAAILTLIFLASNALNRRTFTLLESEEATRKETDRIEAELQIAANVQLSSLPRPFQNTDDVEILAELVPARDVGGDFYNYLVLDKTHIAIMIGDVSGKGAPASLTMMKTVTCFQNFLRPGVSPSEVLELVDDALSQNNPTSAFVTAFIGILDTEKGIFRYANAGHNPPLLKTPKRTFYLPCAHGLVMGTGTHPMYQEEVLRLEKGSLIILYTDGVTEARDTEGKFYGEERFKNLVAKAELSSLVQLRYELKDDIADFTKGAESSDDITYLFMQYQGDRVVFHETEVEATLENFTVISDMIKASCKEEKLPATTENELLVVADEIYSNIAKYAYEDDIGKAYCRFQYNRDKKEVTLLFVDFGIPFDQLSVNNPEMGDDFALRKAGGLGILLVKKTMDDCFYSRLGDKNLLTLKKIVNI